MIEILPLWQLWHPLVDVVAAADDGFVASIVAAIPTIPDGGASVGILPI
jgi:hypothetical protein